MEGEARKWRSNHCLRFSILQNRLRTSVVRVSIIDADLSHASRRSAPEYCPYGGAHSSRALQRGRSAKLVSEAGKSAAHWFVQDSGRGERDRTYPTGATESWAAHRVGG